MARKREGEELRGGRVSSENVQRRKRDKEKRKERRNEKEGGEKRKTGHGVFTKARMRRSFWKAEQE